MGRGTEVSQNLAASSAPGLAEVQAWMRPLGVFPRRGGRLGCLGQLPSPSAQLPGRRVGLSASLLSLQTIGLGSVAGPDSAVSFVSSWLAGRPGLLLAEGTVGAGAWAAQFVNRLTPLLLGWPSWSP